MNITPKQLREGRDRANIKRYGSNIPPPAPTPSATAGGFVLDVMQRAKRGYATETELSVAIRTVEAMAEALRMSADALDRAADAVGGDLAIVLRDRAMFARADLARYHGKTES